MSGTRLGGLLLYFASLACAAHLGACRPSVEEQWSYDLSRSAVAARSTCDGLELDLGTEAARPSLAGGFSWNERSVAETFVWGVGDSSRVLAPILFPRDLRLAARVQAVVDTSVEVAAGGRPIATFEVAGSSSFADVHLVAPSAALRRGLNLLELRYRQAQPGARRAGRDLTVAWATIALQHADAGGGEHACDAEISVVTAENGLRLLPYQVVTWPLELRAGDRLSSALSTQQGGGELVVMLVDASRQERLVSVIDAPSYALDLPLLGGNVTRGGGTEASDPSEPLDPSASKSASAHWQSFELSIGSSRGAQLHDLRVVHN